MLATPGRRCLGETVPLALFQKLLNIQDWILFGHVARQFVVDTKDEAVEPCLAAFKGASREAEDPGTPPEPSSEEFPSRGA